MLLNLRKSVLCSYAVLSGKYLPPFGRIVVPSFLALNSLGGVMFVVIRLAGKCTRLCAVNVLGDLAKLKSHDLTY